MNICSRVRAWTVTGSVCALLSAGTIVEAKESHGATDLSRCRMEVWRIADASAAGNPKSTSTSRIKTRRVFVCDDKTFAEFKKRVGKES
jgi:hypothetical protein